MKHAPRDGENVPDRVEVFFGLDDVENYPARVANAADKQKPERQRRALAEHRLYREDHRPAHQRVADYRRLAEFLQINRVHDDAQNSRAPNDSEQHPADRSAQRNERYRRVSARDQKENRVVIHNAEEALRAAVCQRVVKRRHRVEYDKRGAVDRRADDLPSPAVYRRENNQHRRPRDRQKRAHAVRHGVENLLAERVAFS